MFPYVRDTFSAVSWIFKCKESGSEVLASEMGKSLWPERGDQHAEAEAMDIEEPALHCDQNVDTGNDLESETSGLKFLSRRSDSLRSDKDDSDSDSERPFSPTSVLDHADWGTVHGLDNVQLSALRAVASKGVKWVHPKSKKPALFTLHYGGEVEADGNCLFSAVQRAAGLSGGANLTRSMAVKNFTKAYQEGEIDKARVDQAIRNLYSPDVTVGWGVHIVQEVKYLVKKSDQEAINIAISELVECGMTRETACENVIKERCRPVNDGLSWADYMAVSGSGSDEHSIVSLQYTEEGLINVDENRAGTAAAFGDDIAIECLASELEREVFVVQAHGAHVVDDPQSCLFFLPHAPRQGPSSVSHPPIFLLMKGSDWCGAGADHYEPMLAKEAPSHEETMKLAISL